MGEFFTDREFGKKTQTGEQITVPVFNGIVALYDEYKTSMSKRFPETCPDNGQVVGFNETKFKDSMLAVVPDFTVSEYGHIAPLRKDAWDQSVMLFNQYALLDFIEFCVESINDYAEGDYHSYFSHYHLRFIDGDSNKSAFKDKVNQIFQRNGIAFCMSADWKIQRVLPTGLNQVIINYCQQGNDTELNSLIDQAIKNIVKPKPDDRQIALEKLWDAFERIKTYHLGVDKKTSASQLIQTAAEGSSEIFDLLNDEMKELTSIGNKFRIRHHETDKIKINGVKHIDYLFYRAMSVLSMLIKYL